MAKRRATLVIDIDLARGSKEAHMVTVEKIANKVGQMAVEAFEARGYRVHEAKINTTLHYVRHSTTAWLKRASKRKIRLVG